TGGVDELGGEGHPGHGVVVAADQDGPGPGGTDTGQYSVEQANRVHRGERTVVEVTGHDHHVDPFGPDGVDEVVEDGGLGIEQVLPVEGTTQVPVRSVQQAHGADITEVEAAPSGEWGGLWTTSRPGPGPSCGSVLAG